LVITDFLNKIFRPEPKTIDGDLNEESDEEMKG